MPINANVSGQPQITASVGETKIDVSVSGGVGPTGPAGPAGTTDYTQLTNVPATFPPSQHGHTIAEVTGLQAALDGKQASGSYAASVHTHTAAAITDFSSAALAAVTWGTITGKPSFATVATTGAYADLSGTPSPYTLPTATASVLGGVKIGSGISIDGNGVISASSGYTLPVATGSVLGGVKIGSGVTITDGVISVSTNYAAASHTHTASAITDFNSAAAAAAPVQSVAGRTGAVTLAKGDVGLGNVPNVDATARANHTGTQAISTVSGLQAALDAKAPLADPSFTGTLDINGDVDASVGYFGSVVVAGNNTISNALVSGVSRLTVDGQVVVLGNDARLSDARTPLSHTHNVTDVTGAVSTSDARLSDARTPTDGSVTDAKITSGGLSTSVLNWATIQPWAANTAYSKGALVSNAGIAYRRSAAGTSGATFNIANWQQITPSEFVASQITSGTLDAARLTFATAAQAAAWTNATAVMSAARALDSRLSVLDFAPGGSTYTANGGSASQVAVWAQASSGGTANGSAGFFQNLAGNAWPLMTGVTTGRLNWARPVMIVTRTYRNTGNSANHIMRVAIGDGVGSPFGAPTTRYIGVEARNNRYWLVGHNGTGAFAVDSATDYSAGQADTLTVMSDGSGNAYLFVNGAQVATSASAPSSGAASNANFKYEVGNGGDTASNQWIFAAFRLVYS